MPGPKTFQLVAIVYGLAGMAWGLQMGISENHAMMPAHAHLNLLGWVSLSIMAAFYRSSGRSVSPRLMGLNFLFSALGPLIFAVCLAFELSGQKAATPGIAAGAMMTMAGLVTFGIAVMKTID